MIMDGQKLAKQTLDHIPQASFILQNTDTLFGYIIEYRVTTISQRLQKSECGYIPPAYTSDCIHNPRLFHIRTKVMIPLVLQLSFFFYI